MVVWIILSKYAKMQTVSFERRPTMLVEKRPGIPKYECFEYAEKTKEYVVLIPIINEGDRIIKELTRAKEHHIANYADIVICDGGSTDGCTNEEILRSLDVNTLLIKRDEGKQGAQLRMGISWALERGYEGIITIDGNNKDSIEDVPSFIEKLKEGYDLVQGSRFIEGGKAINTPFIRTVSVRLLHAPVISMTAHQKFTDTTNAYRAYSRRYLTDIRVQPLRDIFMTYELLAYLSVRATQIGMKACEIPVTRAYPKTGKTPTKISFFKGNSELLRILFKNMQGAYNPK
jgi:dolichyl-phosphate beta-D-mannosyltransferase